jgi:3-dehydroquinate synthase
MIAQTQFHIDGKAFSIECSQFVADTLEVAAQSHLYPVILQHSANPLAALKVTLEENSRDVLVIDQHVYALFGVALRLPSERILLMEASETHKSFTGLAAILNFLQQQQVTKSDRLLIVGGGIVQELSAFAAAIYKRGIAYAHYPTTLVAMSDSCIGGKASLNYQEAKNQLGLFSTPQTVTIDIGFLKTLPQDAIYSGLGEVLKACVIGGEYCLNIYQQHVQQGQVLGDAGYAALIRAALLVKKAVIEEDEFERNHRRSLNYGHTLGHALEILSQYVLPHGQAIVAGMMMENVLSHQLGLLPTADLERLNALCAVLLDGSARHCLKHLRLQNLLSLLSKDKKTLGTTAHFVLMAKPGDTRFVPLSLNAVLLQQMEAIFYSVFK